MIVNQYFLVLGHWEISENVEIASNNNNCQARTAPGQDTPHAHWS